MIKVQDFIKYLKRYFGIKITKNAYDSYDGCYFLSDKELKRKIINKIIRGQ